MAIDKSHQGDFFDDYHNEDTSLIINDGVKQPPTVNPYLKRVFKKRPGIKTVDEYMALADDKTGTTQIFDIELVEYFINVDEWEIDSISRYIVRNFPSRYGKDPQKARADSSGAHGFYYVRREAPSEEVELKDTTVYINYTGRLLNGTVFDSSHSSVILCVGLCI